MYFEIYDYKSGNVIERVTELNFGDIIQNQHCVKPIVFRAFSDIETDTTNLKLYLENKGSWKDTEYGYYLSSSLESIEAGSDKLSKNHFTEVPDASSTSLNGVSIGWDTSSSDYIWIDIQVSKQSGMDEANFRLFFESA